MSANLALLFIYLAFFSLSIFNPFHFVLSDEWVELAIVPAVSVSVLLSMTHLTTAHFFRRADGHVAGRTGKKGYLFGYIINPIVFAFLTLPFTLGVLPLVGALLVGQAEQEIVKRVDEPSGESSYSRKDCQGQLRLSGSFLIFNCAISDSRAFVPQHGERVVIVGHGTRWGVFNARLAANGNFSMGAPLENF